MPRKTLLAAVVLLSSFLIPSGPAAADHDVTVKVTRLTTRQISHAIAGRVAKAEFTTAATQEKETGFGAWYNVAYKVDSGDEGGLDLHSNGHQNLFGGDFAFGNFFVGGAVGYFRGDLDLRFDPAVFGAVADQHLDLHVYTVTPYVSYLVNENFFINFLAGYRAQDWEKILGTDLDTHGGFYDASLNLVGNAKIFGPDLPVQFRTQAGFRHEIDKTSGMSLDQIYTATASLDLGVKMGGFKPYGRVWYEASFDTGRDPAEHTGYAGGGAIFALTEFTSLDLGGWTSFGDPDYQEVQLDLSLRVNF